MQQNPIGWIDLPATDLDRAEKFYKDFFGFEFNRQKEEGGFTMSWFLPMEMKSYGSGITLMKGEGYEPCHKGPLLYFTAPGESVKEAIKKAEEQNIKILAPNRAISAGEHGYFACIEDSEGNKIAIHSMKE